jgi:DnaK suppressor protein
VEYGSARIVSRLQGSQHGTGSIAIVEIRTVTATAKERLQARRAELQQRARRVRADLGRENEPLSPDFADQATQRENDAVLGAIGASAEEELALIEAALVRAERGAYDTCAACGQPIEPARRAALAYTDRCADCAQASS